MPRTKSSRTARRASPRPRQIRYAVIGQGYIAQVAVLPAFRHAKRNSRLAALVSDDPKKLKALGRKYGVTRLCGYDGVDELFASGEIDAVYIALPNSMHREYTLRAARAGLHVLCEKPMAVTASDCRQMIDATEQANVKLMIAYRLHFERANLQAVKFAQGGKLGDLRFFTSQFSMQVKDKDNIRLKRDMGGGPLYDIGIYCINAARMLFREEPQAVFAASANSGDERFHEIPETVAATMYFDRDRLASFTCSFGAADTTAYQIVGTRGSLHMEPAYEYAEGLAYELRIGERKRKQKFGKSDQFAPELLYFSDCILKNRDPEPSGLEGLADVRIIEAMRLSMKTGRVVQLSAPEAEPEHPTERQDIRRPPVREPELVHANSPSGS
jgi:glucose-fructose oxidoreductase